MTSGDVAGLDTGCAFIHRIPRCFILSELSPTSRALPVRELMRKERVLPRRTSTTMPKLEFAKRTQNYAFLLSDMVGKLPQI